jgi:hypothetical protein
VFKGVELGQGNKGSGRHVRFLAILGTPAVELVIGSKSSLTATDREKPLHSPPTLQEREFRAKGAHLVSGVLCSKT